MPLGCVVEESETDIFVVLDGVRIARRGKPNTPQAGTWILLQPGYQVSDSKDGSKIVVKCTMGCVLSIQQAQPKPTVSSIDPGRAKTGP